MISARDAGGVGDRRNTSGATYWTSDSDGDLHAIENWNRTTFAQFRKALTAACSDFPDLPPESQEDEKHLALCIHGYNNGFDHSIDFYNHIQGPALLR